MSDEYKISAKIDADSSGFSVGIEEAIKGLGSFGESIVVMNQGLQLAQEIFGSVSAAVDQMVSSFMEAQDGEARLEAILRTTQGVAGQTSESLDVLASSLAKTTVFDDDAVKGAESLLLTFKNIRGEVFDQTIPAILDLSAAFGQDLRSSSIMLGKALDDPANGLTALRKIGVSFSEEETNVIKAMNEAGDVAGAQAKILEVLKGQVGGVSEAMAQSSSGAIKKFNQAVEDSQKAIGGLIVNGLAPFAVLATEFIRGFLDASTTTDKFITSLQGELDKQAELERQSRTTIGVINEKNSSDKLTLDQYNALISAYPQLKGQVDAYTTTLAQAKAQIDAVAAAERERILAQLQAQASVAAAQYQTQLALANQLARAYGLQAKETYDLATAQRQAYEIEKAAGAERDKRISQGSPVAAETARYNNLVQALQGNITALKNLNAVKEAENNLSETGSVLTKKQGDSLKTRTDQLSDAQKTWLAMDEHFYEEQLAIQEKADERQQKELDASIKKYQKSGSGYAADWKKLQEQNAAAAEAADRRIEASNAQMTAAVTSTMTTLVSGPFVALGEALAKGQDAWQAFERGAVHALAALVRGIGDQLISMAAADLVKAAAAAVTGNFPAAAGFTAAAAIETAGGAAAYTASGALAAYETGTQYAAAGYALVGERGPELVKLSQGDQVKTASETQGVLGGGGGHTFVFNSPKAMNPTSQIAAFQRTARALRFKGVLV